MGKKNAEKIYAWGLALPLPSFDLCDFLPANKGESEQGKEPGREAES